MKIKPSELCSDADFLRRVHLDLTGLPPGSAEVRAFLTTYYGNDGTSGQSLSEPMRTLTARHRLGLVTVAGEEYQVTDIGLRMLQPHELLRAQFGRFADGSRRR